MPTVAAVRAGASLMPSPMKMVSRASRFHPNQSEFLFRALARIDFADADFVCQIPDLLLSVAGNDHHAIEGMLRLKMLE
jgi:hypothetical protein